MHGQFSNKSIFQWLKNAILGKADANHGHEISEVTNLQSALDGKATTSHLHVQGDVADLISDLTALQNRISALEAWKSVMPIRVDEYTGTTDANGDVTVAFPTGRYAKAPALVVTYVFNNDNYGTMFNVKSLSATSAQLRVHRNKNTSVVLGGNIDPDEPLASTAVRVLAIAI